MADDFDPYHKWLGISPKDRPPNHYRLLGIELFETDPDVIEGAADQRMSHVRTFQTGQNSALSQRILNELSAAKLCLLTPQKKAEYDRQLREKIEREKVAAAAKRPSDSGGVLPVMPVAQPLQAAPLPLAQPLPQAAPRPVTDAAPVIIAEEETSTSSIHRRPYRQTPVWRQPAVLGTAGALVLFGLVAYFLSSSGKLPTTEVSTVKPPSKTSTGDTPVDRPAAGSAKVKPSDSRSSSPPGPDKRSSATPVSPPTVEPPVTTRRDVAPRKREPSPLLVVGESGSPVDVLAAIDLDRDRLRGNWQYNGQTLISPSDTQGDLQVQLPAIVPANYQLDLTAQRESGDDCLSFSFPVSGTTGSLVIDGSQGTKTGLQMIDGKAFMNNETTREAKVFADGQPHSLNLRVQNSHVRLYCDGKQLADWTIDLGRLKPSQEPPYNDRIYLGNWRSRYRISKIKLRALRTDSTEGSPPTLAGEPIDLLKQINPKRDTVKGDWQVVDGVLVSPDEPFSRLLLPAPPAADYQVTIVGERVRGGWGLGLAVVVGGRQAVVEIDGFNGHFTGLTALDGKNCNENETARQGRLLVDGKSFEALYTVRGNGVRLTLDGRNVIDWRGDSNRLSMIDGYKLPDATRLAVCEFNTVCRISKIEIAPLAPEPAATTPRVATTSPEKPTAGVLKIFEDEPEFVEALNAGNGRAALTRKECYSGKASVMISGEQRFSEALPGLDVKIRKNPRGPDEYRYLRFAWKKRGGREIYLQLHHPINWFRYCAGTSGTYTPAVTVADQLPTEFSVVTRDLAADFGEFELNGIALSAVDGEWACFDHIYLGRTLKDFDSIKVPANKRERIFPDFASGGRSDQLQPVPDDETLKKARQEMQKNFSSAMKAAKTPDQKRSLAQEMAEKAAVEDKGGPYTYVLFTQAIDLAEAAGDLDLAWKTIDQLARSFDVDGMDLRNRSLIDAGKTAKTPERAWELADTACRLMIAALNAGDAATVKKAGAQAHLLAKRTKDKNFQKLMTGRADDTAKLATEIEAVNQARETLKTMPLDAHANQVVGHYELCATGDWSAALPKLARSDDAEWQKLAANESSLGGQLVEPAKQLAIADAWWARAEEEPWPGRHYLHMRAAKWYRNAYKSLVDVSRVRAADRLKALLAVDEGLPNWELFNWSGFQRDDPSGDVVRVELARSMETAVEYEGSIEVLLVARTTGNQIRLSSHNTFANWNFTVEPNRWHTLRYLFTPFSRTAFVDGLPVDNDTWKTARRLSSAPVHIYASDQNIVEVKKFIVKPL
jgi:hypothetical protein